MRLDGQTGPNGPSRNDQLWEARALEILSQGYAPEQCRSGNGFGGDWDPSEKVVSATKRRIEITLDQRRLVILKRRGASVSNWCSACGRLTAMLTPDEAARVLNVSSRTIYRRVEAGEVHYTETPEGLLRVCANSIGE